MEDENKEINGGTPPSDEGKTLDPSLSNKTERTEAEKAAYNLKKNAERVKELGLNPKKVLGDDEGDEVPAWYKKEKAKETKKTAIDLADSISDEETKEKVKEYLENRIVPSGNPDDDFRLALGAVSATKNKQIIDELNRYNRPRVSASGSSQPAPFEEEFVPTEHEAIMMAKPYNLSKEKILAARKKAETKA